jgi:O-acetyl-ADP-ribose deacetylase (regulator of RNase III)
MILIRVEQGDISLFAGDGIVNAANNHLILGSGVAGAIRERGGPLIQQECDAWVRQYGLLAVGQAAVTGGGDLAARWVIHAAAMGDQPADADTIRRATASALRLASLKEIGSLAFPVLGAGVGGFPFEHSARILIEEIRGFRSENRRPDSAVLYGYTQDDADTLRRLLV